MSEKVRITLLRSVIGEPERVRRVVQALGLGRLGSSAIKANDPAIAGMLRKVRHLVSVEES